MKIAQYRYIGKHSYDTVSEDSLEGAPDFIRISDYVDVEFPPLSDEELITRQLSALDAAEQALRESFQSRLDDLKQQRANLLALPNLRAVAV